MQLATNIIILACAIVFSTPVVLALPVSRGAGSQAIDAREFDHLVAVRELIRQYYEARELYDELDSRTYHNVKQDESADRVYTRDSNNTHLDPELSKVLLDSTKANTPIFLYAQQANRELEAYQRLSTFDKLKNAELKALISAKFAAQQAYINKIKAKDSVALAQSTLYRAKLASITNGQDAAAITEKKDKADRLERILKNPNDNKDIQEVIKYLKAKNTDDGFMTTTP